MLDIVSKAILNRPPNTFTSYQPPNELHKINQIKDRMNIKIKKEI